MATRDIADADAPRKRVFTPEQAERKRLTGIAYHARNREKRNAQCRERQKLAPKRKRVRTPEYQEKKRAKQRADYAAGKRRIFTPEQKERRRSVMAAYRETHCEELKQKAKARIAANPEPKKAYGRKWITENKERAAASRRAWKAANIEKVKMLSKKWHKEHPGSQAAYRAAHRKEGAARALAWRKANPDRHRALTKKWAAKNPHKIRAMLVRRKLVKRGASIGDTNLIAEWEKKWKRLRTIICYWCRTEVPTKGCQTDHIIPISKNGPHTISNLCVACWPCNNSKNAKTIEAWNQQISEPVLF